MPSIAAKPFLAVLGDRDLSHRTHRELDAELARMPAGVEAAWLPSPRAPEAAGADAIWVAPGTPYADDDAVLAAIDRAVDDGTPLLGTCGGFQYAVLALVRRAGLAAAHAESEPEAEDPLIAPLACSLYGEEREVTCVPGSRLAEICGTAPFTGFHFCGFGLAAGREADLEAAGAVIAARAPDAGIEGIELPGHPFFLATLFQPQVGALDGRPRHPLVAALISASRHGIDPGGSHPRRRVRDLDERVEAA
jgi:CTP synthase (UTP-ammonia lyase)